MFGVRRTPQLVIRARLVMIRRVETLPYESAPPADTREATFAQKAAWVMYDWANSGYGLIVIGPVFAPFFIKVLLPPLSEGSDEHGLTLGSTVIRASAITAVLTSMSMALMAVGAPMLGAIADIKGWTKRLLITFATIGSLLTMAMIVLRPGQWVLGGTLYVLSNFCFGTSLAFANAYLPRLTRPERQGSLSGWGFAAGYVGGAVALIIVLVMISTWPNDPRVVAAGLALSGAWWILFSLPAFFLLDEFPPMATDVDRSGSLITAGFRRVKNTFVHLKRYRTLFLFLLAFLLYNDGVETVIAMAGSFGTDYLKMSDEKLIVMFLIVQFVAFGGALVFGYVSDRIGNKRVILINLIVWLIATFLALMTRPEPLFTVFGITFDGTNQFIALGVLIGLVLGGVQAASRSLMAALTPKEIHNEAFGFFSMSGKFASIFGPLLYGGLVMGTGNPRWGILSVPPFLIGGLIVLLMVREPRK
ncbi:MAG: MFS transporter [Tepidisphaeraceae bacterium]